MTPARVSEMVRLLRANRLLMQPAAAELADALEEHTRALLEARAVFAGMTDDRVPGYLEGSNAAAAMRADRERVVQSIARVLDGGRYQESPRAFAPPLTWYDLADALNDEIVNARGAETATVLHVLLNIAIARATGWRRP